MPDESSPIRALDPAELGAQFRAAEPFPFLCLDDVLEPDFAHEVADAYPAYEQARKVGKTFYGVNEMRKVEITKEATFPAPVRRLADALTAPAFRALLEGVTGIGDLQPDPD